MNESLTPGYRMSCRDKIGNVNRICQAEKGITEGGKATAKGSESGMCVVQGNRAISGCQEPSVLGGRCIC